MTPSDSDPKKNNPKVHKAITPGMKAAQSSVNDPSSRSAKKIVISTTSSRISSQGIDVQHERDTPTPASTPVVTPREQERSSSGPGLIKIIVFSFCGLAALTAAILYTAHHTKTSKKTRTPPSPPQTADLVQPTLTKEVKPPPSPAPLIQDGLLAHWKLDGNLKDATGIQGDGQTINPPVFIKGKQGKAIRLNGADPVIVGSITDTLKGLQDHFSVCFWVRVPADVEQAPWPAIISRGDSIFRVTLRNTENTKFNFSFGTKDAPDRTGMNTGERDIPADTWHYFTLVRDGSKAYLYVNGTQRSTRANVATQINGDTDIPLVIGGGHKKRRQFIGDIDDVRIYNRALDSTEIPDLMGHP